MKVVDYLTGQKKISKARLAKLTTEFFLIAIGAIVVFLVAANYDFFESAINFISQHEDYELDEMIIVAIYLLISLFILSIHWLRLLVRSEREAKNLYNELIIEQAKVKYLHGVIPICASCKKIRDDEGAWQELEEYIHNNSEASFTHGICRECITKLYPDIDIDAE